MQYIRTLLIAFLVLSSTYSFAQSPCEHITTASLEKLIPILERNNFAQLDPVIFAINNSCEESEFTLRLTIIKAIINKENTVSLIDKYLNKRFDDILVKRHDSAADKDYEKIYHGDPAAFGFVPLRHKVDELVQQKAIALLNSQSYTLTEKEVALLFLFADEIDAFYTELDRKPAPRPVLDKIREREYFKSAPTFGIHAGVFTALGDRDYMGTSSMFGLSLMGRLDNQFVPEFMFKFRLHNNQGKQFDFDYKNSIQEINSKSSYFLGGGLGYKILDSGPFILLPKIGLGYGFIWTGLSETIYSENEYGEEVSSLSFRNVNTLHSSAGIAGMLHLRRKQYIGLEINYHLVPYNWEKRLLTSMQSNYASLELFFRF